MDRLDFQPAGRLDRAGEQLTGQRQVARAFNAKLGQSLGQAVVILHRPLT